MSSKVLKEFEDTDGQLDSYYAKKKKEAKAAQDKIDAGKSIRARTGLIGTDTLTKTGTTKDGRAILDVTRGGGIQLAAPDRSTVIGNKRYDRLTTKDKDGNTKYQYVQAADDQGKVANKNVEAGGVTKTKTEPKTEPRTEPRTERRPAPKPPTAKERAYGPRSTLNKDQQAVNREYDRLRKTDPEAAAAYGKKMAARGAANKDFKLKKPTQAQSNPTAAQKQASVDASINRVNSRERQANAAAYNLPADATPTRRPAAGTPTATTPRPASGSYNLPAGATPATRPAVAGGAASTPASRANAVSGRPAPAPAPAPAAARPAPAAARPAPRPAPVTGRAALMQRQRDRARPNRVVNPQTGARQSIGARPAPAPVQRQRPAYSVPQSATPTTRLESKMTKKTFSQFMVEAHNLNEALPLAIPAALKLGSMALSAWSAYKAGQNLKKGNYKQAAWDATGVIPGGAVFKGMRALGAGKRLAQAGSFGQSVARNFGPGARAVASDKIAGKVIDGAVGAANAMSKPSNTPTSAARPTPAARPKTTVLAKKGGVQGTLDKSTGKFTAKNWSDAQSSRYKARGGK